METSQTQKSECDYGSIENASYTGRNADLTASVQEPSCCRSACCVKYFPSGYVKEFKPLMLLAAPIILTLFLQYSLSLMAIIFCGQLGKTELDAVALSNTLINVSGISIAEGLCTACDTFFSQTYTSENKHKLGILLQRSICVVLLALLPCWAIHLNTEGLFLILGQDPEISRLAGRYLLLYMPGMFFFFLYMCLEKYVQCQDIVIPNFIVAIICNIINGVLHYVFVYLLELRTDGSAIAQSISDFFLFSLTLGYIIIKGIYKDNWSGFSIDALRDWGAWIKLGLYGLLMICIEWWAFEIGNILAGVLGTTELGAQSVLFSCESIAFMLPLGLGIAASIQIGHYLGAGDARAAKTTSSVAITVMYFFGSCSAITYITLRNYLPYIFTSDSDVVAMASTILPILGAYMVFDTTSTITGILRGCGRQKTGFICVSIAYPAGLAIGLPLMFKTQLKVSGYWIGLASAMLFMNIVYSIIVLRTNWDEQVRLASERTTMEYGGEESDMEKDHHYDTDEKSVLIEKRNRKRTQSGSSNQSRNSSVSRQGLLGHRSGSLGHQVSVGMKEEDISASALVLRRLPVVLGAVVILGVGLGVRLFVPIPHIQPPGNFTSDASFDVTSYLQQALTTSSIQ